MPEDNASAFVGGDYWNSAPARAWAEHHVRQDRALAGLATAALDLAAPQPGERVLDIGCGSGTTVLALAARVAPTGYVLGADIAQASVERARERIAAHAGGISRAEIVCTDAATHPFPAASFDLVFSRLGVMFFTDPTGAFANLRRAMKPTGRLAMAVFRSEHENPWPGEPLAAVRHLLPPMPPPAAGAPGMFALGDPARVRHILEGGGFREVSLTPVDPALQIASPGDGSAAEAADFALLFGPLTRILPGLPAERREAVRAGLERFFADRVTPLGVALPAAFWIVQARA